MTNVCFYKTVKRIIMMSSMIFLSSSSFFLPAYLTDKLERNNYSASQFDFSLQKNYSVALNIEEAKHKDGSSRWLSINKKLAHYQSNSALKLGQWYKQKWYKNKILNKPIEDVEQHDLYQAKMWLEQSISLGSTEANLLLAKLYYEDKKFKLSRETLDKYPDRLIHENLVGRVLRLRIKLAIYFGDVELVNQLLKDETLLNSNSELGRLYADIIKYGIGKTEQAPTELTKAHVKEKANGFGSTNAIKHTQEEVLPCITSLQLFATSLEHLKHLEKLIKEFKVRQPLSQLICLPTPRYVSKQLIKCEAKAQQAIVCNEAQWQNIPKDISSRHVGLMLEQGGANVYLGILYFDADDDSNVFSHEVSHLLGFIDEYPLSKNHQICQNVQGKPFSHNIAVLKPYYQGDKKKVRENLLKSIPWADDIAITTPIVTADKSTTHLKQKRWRLGTPASNRGEVGVYPAETCENAFQINHDSSKQSEVNNAAFKPLFQRTQLRYNESDFPKEYLSMIKKRPLIYLMPSYHYNIALALYQKGDIESAKVWLEKSSNWEVEPSRKRMILQGAF